jgi:uncharacterized protein (DUF169 family)
MDTFGPRDEGAREQDQRMRTARVGGTWPTSVPTRPQHVEAQLVRLSQRRLAGPKRLGTRGLRADGIKGAMLETQLQSLLHLASPPIAVSFCPTAPAGVARVANAEPAGCGYWRRAAGGEVFYTEAEDHAGCPVGAHTHGVTLSPATAKELAGLVDVMVGLEYLKPTDVAQIPTRKEPFGVAIYAPLAAAPVPPDVVLVRGNARQLMMLAEAAHAAGVAGSGPTLGRPTCAVLPEAINSGRSAASFGCIGNRVYTDAADGDAYFAIPGDKLAAVEERLAVMVHANTELEKFHRARRDGSEAGRAARSADVPSVVDRGRG